MIQNETLKLISSRLSNLSSLHPSPRPNVLETFRLTNKPFRSASFFRRHFFQSPYRGLYLNPTRSWEALGNSNFERVSYEEVTLPHSRERRMEMETYRALGRATEKIMVINLTKLRVHLVRHYLISKLIHL